MIKRKRGGDREREREPQPPFGPIRVRSAVHGSQQLISPVDFLSSRLPPSLCQDIEREAEGEREREAETEMCVFVWICWFIF